jgi:hypothetical protein
MIINTPGTYPIVSITCENSIGNPYQLRELIVSEVDEVNQKVYSVDTGWIDWDVPLLGEKKK